VPKSARQAETMVAKYPDPYTAMYITNLSCAALLGVLAVEGGGVSPERCRTAVYVFMFNVPGSSFAMWN
jgi:hypothetical protein